ncbi:MAG: hypothetical protein IT289_00315 [Oligoflexia bacterium]|nr:hypothetical protein [Oligoflexia bacterium]
MPLILILFLAIFGLFNAQATEFDENLCGIRYPKKDLGAVAVPSTPFMSDHGGIMVALYPLVCRGGGPIEIKQEFTVGTTVVHGHSSSGAPVELPISGVGHQVIFRKAPVAANATGSNLSPGECAWRDRALSAREPAQLEYGISNNFRVTLSLTQKRNAAGEITQKIEVPHPVEINMLMHSSAPVFFYRTRTSPVAVPMCELRGMGPYPVPYAQIRY